MLEITVERAYEPEMMRRQPCGVCGADFEPKAVVAQLMTDCELPLVCEPCLENLAHRAESKDIPANWDEIYRRYLKAVPKYPEPIYPSVQAVIDAESRDPEGTMAYLLETAKI